MRQADYHKVRQHMLDRLWNVFGEPKAHDVTAFIDEYVSALSRYDEEDLQAGCDKIFQSLKVKSWPTIKECIDATKKAASERWEAERKRRAEAGQPEPGDEARAARAAAIERTVRQLAKPAIEQGWILGLHDFVWRHDRLPTVAEQRELQRGADYVTRAAAGEIEMGVFDAQLRELAQSMVEKRDRMAVKYGEGL